MKIVYSHSDSSHLHNLANLLVENGIPATVQGENTGRIMPFAFFQASLWIYIDSQYDESVALIADPDYEVKAPVDMAEFEKITKDAGSAKSVNKALIDLLLYAIFLIACGFVLIKVLQWLQT